MNPKLYSQTPRELHSANPQPEGLPRLAIAWIRTRAATGTRTCTRTGTGPMRRCEHREHRETSCSFHLYSNGKSYNLYIGIETSSLLVSANRQTPIAVLHICATCRVDYFVRCNVGIYAGRVRRNARHSRRSSRVFPLLSLLGGRVIVGASLRAGFSGTYGAPRALDECLPKVPFHRRFTAPQKRPREQRRRHQNFETCRFRTECSVRILDFVGSGNRATCDDRLGSGFGRTFVCFNHGRVVPSVGRARSLSLTILAYW